MELTEFTLYPSGQKGWINLNLVEGMVDWQDGTTRIFMACSPKQDFYLVTKEEAARLRELISKL